MSAISQMGEVSGLREQHPWLRDGPFHTQQQVFADLEAAWQRHWTMDAARPRYWSSHDPNQPALHFPDGFTVKRHWLTLPKLGRIRWYGVLPEHGHRITSVTLRLDGDCWRVSFAVAAPVETRAPRPEGPVAIDVGVRAPLTDSLGRVAVLPVATRAERRVLRMRQRRVSRKTTRGQPASHNRGRACRALARLQRRIANRIANARHEHSTTYAKNHRVIVIEDLSLRNMTASAAGTEEDPGTNVRQKAGLNRAMLELGHGEFRRQLAYKTGWHGGSCWAVPAAYSSQTCATCGHVHAGNRNQAAFLCLSCGHADDADHNAAVVLLQRWQRGLGKDITIHLTVPTDSRKRIPVRRKAAGVHASGASAAMPKDTTGAGQSGAPSAQEPIGSNPPRGAMR